jgi:hypothetical protein
MKEKKQRLIGCVMLLTNSIQVMTGTVRGALLAGTVRGALLAGTVRGALALASKTQVATGNVRGALVSRRSPAGDMD